MRRDEENGTTRCRDEELLFRLRHIASGRCGNATVDGALEYAIADGTLSRARAAALRQALVDEGVVDDLRTIAEKAPGGLMRRFAPGECTIDQLPVGRPSPRCDHCGYTTDSIGHHNQCGGK